MTYAGNGIYAVSALGFPDCEGSFLPREARHGTPDSMPALSGRGTDQPGLLQQVRQSDTRTLSDLALGLIHGDRADEYAPPEENLTAIGAVWGVLLRDHVPGEPIPSWRVALLMAALKIVRAGHKPGDDSLVDGAGYLELVRRLRP